MPLRRPEVLFIGCGTAVGLALIWTYVDLPQPTGRYLRGTISYCHYNIDSKYLTADPWCMVRVDSDSVTLRVNMIQRSPGKQITLIELRKRVTGRLQYVPQYASEP